MAFSLTIAAALAATIGGGADNSEPEALSCAYKSRADKELISYRDCAEKDGDGGIHLRWPHSRRLDYDRHGLAVIFVDRYYYARRDGRMLSTLTFDNWAAPFRDGLARTEVRGKIAYFDRRLRLQIPARFDGAFPFVHGVAIVCLRCIRNSDGEHSWYEGGVWGCIDQSGRALAPFRPLNAGQSKHMLCSRDRNGDWPVQVAIGAICD